MARKFRIGSKGISFNNHKSVDIKDLSKTLKKKIISEGYLVKGNTIICEANKEDDLKNLLSTETDDELEFNDFEDEDEVNESDDNVDKDAIDAKDQDEVLDESEDEKTDSNNINEEDEENSEDEVNESDDNVDKDAIDAKDQDEILDKILDESEDSETNKENSEDEVNESDDNVDKDAIDAKDQDEVLDESVKTLLKAAKLDESFAKDVSIILKVAAANIAKKMIKEEKNTLANRAAKILERKRITLENTNKAYLSNVVDEWKKNNIVSVRNEARLALSDQLFTDIKSLFESYNIQIPETKIDAYSKLSKSHDELTKKLNVMESQLENFRQKDIRRSVEETIENLSDGMTSLDKTRFRTMLENFEFNDIHDFNKKAKIVHENFFTGRPSSKKIINEENQTLSSRSNSIGLLDKNIDDDISATLKILQKNR